MGSEDHTQIVKGKRTKRQRSSSSPFGFPATDTSSSGSGDAYYHHYESTEEEEEEEQDMANCLIMLAQGDPFKKSTATSSVTVTVTGTSDNNKVGLYIYECKTCNRSFTSFQALGGHRASHKKPKATLELAEKKSSPTDFDSASAGSSPLLVHHNHNINKGNKIHECSICGSEFTSGQALGGHMRRHRAAAAAANKQVTNESNIIAGAGAVAVAATTRSVLPLDLNLPAPEDDRYFGFGSTTQKSLVFSAPALVDCHY